MDLSRRDFLASSSAAAAGGALAGPAHAQVPMHVVQAAAHPRRAASIRPTPRSSTSWSSPEMGDPEMGPPNPQRLGAP